MALIDTAAQNASLDNDYGATAGPNAPAAHQLALFNGDPRSGGTELDATGGYARVTVSNDGTNWPAAVSGQKTCAAQQFADATAAWSDTATWFGLFDDADGSTLWDAAPLNVEIAIDAAGPGPAVAPRVNYSSL